MKNSKEKKYHHIFVHLANSADQTKGDDIRTSQSAHAPKMEHFSQSTCFHKVQLSTVVDNLFQAP